MQNLGRPRTPELSLPPVGLEPASTRSEPSQSLHRSGAAVGWIRRTDDEVEDETPHTTAAVADYLTQLTQALFVNSDNDNNDDAWEAEPLQVVHYNASGYYHLHHDGFQRAVTVLHYWNGVAGTWFPWAGKDHGTAGPDQEAWDWQNPSQLVQYPHTRSRWCRVCGSRSRCVRVGDILISSTTSHQFDFYYYYYIQYSGAHPTRRCGSVLQLLPIRE